MKNKVIFDGKEFETKVAISEKDQEVGLMFSSWPPPVMSFPFAKSSVKKFWMKNTTTPLDIVFVKANKVISIEKGDPLSTKLVGPDEAVDLVVELPAGTCKDAGVVIGSHVSLKIS